MCFMLPKPDVLPAVLVNVYGILAHEVFTESNFGTCIMQNETYSSRCPRVRLNNWYTLKRGDQSKLDIEIRESEQRYEATCQGQISNASSPEPSHSATSPLQEESSHVLLMEG
jgi:hypothetical protein